MCGLVARSVTPKYNPHHTQAFSQLPGGSERKAIMSVQKKTLLGQKKTKNTKAAKGKLDAKPIKSVSKEINLRRVGGGSPVKY
jgi:hypothetical protein